MSSVTDQIKGRLSITDVVGSYIKLEKAGGNFRARCPFHNEKTPSFFISPGRETYHCFGCDKGGDIFSFVQEFEGVDFMSALKILAERAGVRLTTANVEMKGEREQMKKALALAAKFFELEIKKRVDVLAYLQNRGLSDATISMFRIGFAPADWRALYSYLLSQGVTSSVMESAGLVIAHYDEKRGQKSYYDRFRGRIMFPIEDAASTVVAFTGRIFEGAFKDTDPSKQGGKYVNSPETALFNKGRTLYGLNKSKTPIRLSQSCVLVEGQMDLIMSYQSGITNVVAASGTALSEEHLKLIARLTDNIVIAFDTDEAGMAAASRAFKIGLGLGLNMKAVLVPGGKDPADLAAADPIAWREAVGASKHVVEFLLDTLVRRGLEGRELFKEVTVAILPYVAIIPNAIEKAHFVKTIAERLRVDEGAVWEEERKAEARLVSTQPAATKKLDREVATPAERKLELLKLIVGLLCLLAEKDKDLADRLETEFRNAAGEQFKLILDNLSAEKSDLALEALYRTGNHEQVKRTVEEKILLFEEEMVKYELSKLVVDMKAAEAENGDEQLSVLQKKFLDLSNRRSNLQEKRAKL